MPADLRPITLDPGTEPWERQPGETIKRFNQFTVYRDAGRARTLRRAAEKLALAPAYVRDVAAAYHWPTRAERWDHNRDQLHQAAWLDARREAAERDASVLSDALRKLAARLATLDPAELAPAEVMRGLDVVLKHRRVLYGDPTATVALTGPGGGAVQVDAGLAEWRALAPEARARRMIAFADDIRRRARAALDDLDDDE